MKLATFIAPGETAAHAGEVRGDEVVAFADGTVLDRLESGDRTPANGQSYALSDVQLLEPVPRPPAIFCIGRNYAAHIAELGSERPEKPLVFLKLPLSSTRPSGPVRTPKASQALDYEVELVLVLGPDATIAGYAVANDVSARDLQRSEAQWSRGGAGGGAAPRGAGRPGRPAPGRAPPPPRPAAPAARRGPPPARPHQRPAHPPRGALPLQGRGRRAGRAIGRENPFPPYCV